MNLWTFDFETHLVQPGLVAPPPVCAAFGPVGESRLGTPLEALHALVRALEDETTIVNGANVAFDFLVGAVYALANYGIDLMPLIFQAYRASRVFDIQIVEMLHAIANGHLGIDPRTGSGLRDPETGEKAGYRLSVCADLVLGRIDAKRNDEWRKRYHELEPYPIETWPEPARQYPVDDKVNTEDTALAQLGLRPRISPHQWGFNPAAGGPVCTRCMTTDTNSIGCTVIKPSDNLHDAPRQIRTAWAMHLGGAYGFAVDPPAVAELEATVGFAYPDGTPTPRAKERDRFIAAGIVRDNGTENQSALKKLVAEAYGATAPCPTCAGTGKVPSAKTGKPVICKACDGTSYARAELAIPSTDGGGVGKGRDVLAESGNELLMAYADYKADAKIASTYLPWLRQALVQCQPHDPGAYDLIIGGVKAFWRAIPLTLKPNVLVETGRTSYSEVVQLLPRTGGVRECIKARDGRLLSSSDYEAGELITHGQSCIWITGGSVLAEQLVAGKKPHNALAARLHGISYDEFNARLKTKDKRCVDLRNAAKAANFGFPGRMGGWTLVLQKRKEMQTPHPSGPRLVEDENGDLVPGYKGLRFCLMMGEAERCGERMVTEHKKRSGPPTCAACIRAAERLRADWLNTYPENHKYFAHVKELVESGRPVVQHVSGRLRGVGHEDGNAVANGYFQGLLADAAKDAVFDISEECYTRKDSPLYGSVLIVFQHDEVIVEHPAATSHEAAMRVGYLMEEQLRWYCPDLAPAVRAEPAIMGRWYKGASPVCSCGPACKEPGRHPGGRLIAWEPKRK